MNSNTKAQHIGKNHKKTENKSNLKFQTTIFIMRPQKMRRERTCTSPINPKIDLLTHNYYYETGPASRTKGSV